MRRRRTRPLALLASIFCWVCALLPWGVGRSALGQGVEVELELVAGGLDRPVGVTHAGDGSGRLFIAEQSGAIRILEGGAVRETPFLDLRDAVTCCGEMGLLGLAFHPDFASNDLFYVHYSDLDGDNVLAEYAVSDDPSVADPLSARTLLSVEQPFGNHNGGHLAFGPDGYLYVALGDGGSAGDPLDQGQDLSTLLGSLLRIDVDGADPGLEYSIPGSNPFVDVPGAAREIWAYGLRNPWRFSFDRATGDLWIGDVGQNAFEEIDLEVAGGAGGVNYGWRKMEGFECFEPPVGCDDGTLTTPIYAYPHVGGGSVTAGYRYRGSAHPSWTGLFFLADFALDEGRVSVPRCDGVWEFRTLPAFDLSVATFGEDEEGELYAVDYRFADSDSDLYRLRAVPETGPELGFVPASVEFGGLALGGSAEREVVVSHVGAGPEAVVVAEIIAPDTPFTVDLAAGATPCGEAPCLAPGESCTLAVRFDPAVAGNFTDELFLDANSPVRAVPLDGFAAEPCEHEAAVEVRARTISGSETVEACRSIEVGPDVEVAGTGSLTLRAGEVVRLGDGTAVRGGELRAEIDRLLTIE